jgi:hypothetical protein
LKEITSLLELALWKARIDDASVDYAMEVGNKKMTMGGMDFRVHCRISCGAEHVLENVLPYLLPPDFVRSDEDTDSDDSNVNEDADVDDDDNDNDNVIDDDDKSEDDDNGEDVDDDDENEEYLTTTMTTMDIIDVKVLMPPPLAMVLCHVALFLPRSSRALLGAALTPSSTSLQSNWDNDKWEILDFSDLDKDLAARLTDDDLYNILTWIDAKKRLRILKLTGCVNIIGHGLRILHDAINLRQIDLSLVGRSGSPIVVPESALVQAVVLPILSHMVKNKHVDIKHIQMPKHWRIIKNNLGTARNYPKDVLIAELFSTILSVLGTSAGVAK